MTPNPALCFAEDWRWGWGVGSDWLQTAPGLKPKGEWKPLLPTSEKILGVGKDSRVPAPRAQPLLSHPRSGSAFTPLLPLFFKGWLSFAQVEIG